MDKKVNEFQLDDKAESPQRLDQLTNKADDLGSERGMAAYLLERAVAKGQLSTACALLKISGSLAEQNLGLRLRKSKSLTTESAIAWANSVVQIVHEELLALPGISEALVNETLDRVVKRVLGSLTATVNAPKDVRRLEHHPDA